MHGIRKGLIGLAALALGVAAAAAPATSQAIVQTGQDFALQSVPTPRPAAGQVLIQVYAAAINPVDWKRRSRIPGFDVAGVIDSVGPGVTAFKPGDAVLARASSGGYAQYAVAPVETTIAKPKAFTFEEASGVPVAGVAGYRAVEEARLKAGQRVAIIGAAGGSGEVAVQVAKTKGARIIAVGHSSQEGFLRGLGVDEFVAFDRENVAARVQDVDAAINLVDGQATAALGYVKRGGRFTSIAGSPGTDRAAAAGVGMVVIAGGSYNGISDAQALAALARLAEQGRYRVTVSASMALEEAARAQELARTGQTIGKIVLVVDPAKAKTR